MGWHKVENLKTRPSTYGGSGLDGLWTRGGLEGVYIRHAGEEIVLPRPAILRLVAEELASRMISRVEQMTAGEVLEMLTGGHYGPEDLAENTDGEEASHE